MYMVLCETPHGTRYHVFTEMPESYYEDLVYQFGPVDDPEGAVDSGYYRPEEWDENGDAESASGEDYESYLEQKKRYEFQELEQKRELE